MKTDASTEWSVFDAAYKKACESSQPTDWMHAALAAQRVRNDCSSGPSHEGWISVEDRLPELSGWYMAWFQHDHAVLHFDNQIGWYWGDGEHVMDEPYVSHITHWMELPDAPTATHSEGDKQ